MDSRSSALRHEGGFTLAELMVVVLIIGVLVSIAIPVYSAARARSQQRSCFANQRTLDGAAQTYLADHTQNDLTQLNALLWQAAVSGTGEPFVGSFVQSPPECPRVHSSNYTCDANGYFACPAPPPGDGHARYDT
jgi:prepilin-type N-terminal cleavage/methylation domain-containing protein